MGKKKKDKAAELTQWRNVISESLARWMGIREYGCRDPFWPDGANMDLERNHILAAKKEIMDLCYDLNLSLPNEYFIKTPPEVSNKYMAALRKGSGAAEDPIQAERLAKLRKTEFGLTGVCPEYELEMSLL